MSHPEACSESEHVVIPSMSRSSTVSQDGTSYLGAQQDGTSQNGTVRDKVSHNATTSDNIQGKSLPVILTGSRIEAVLSDAGSLYVATRYDAIVNMAVFGLNDCQNGSFKLSTGYQQLL